MIHLTDVTLKRGQKTLFSGLDLTVHAGHRAGIVGRNGVGKSTLFLLLRGRLVPEEGEVRVPRSWTIAHLDQETEPSPASALEWTIDGDRPLGAVRRRIEAAEAGDDQRRLPALYAELDSALPDDVVMASSTSGLIMSELQAGFSNAARYVVGHPFNPPHLIPLVEVVGGADTGADVVDWTIGFYNTLGKKAIRLNHEAPGHLVNRLQVALWREAMDAVLTGLASVEDVDDAIKYGPGLRLSVMGPFELCHLAGGPEGYPNFLDHFGDALQLWMDDMRTVELTPEVRSKLKALVADAIGERGFESVAEERDTLLLPVLSTLARTRREHGLY